MVVIRKRLAIEKLWVRIREEYRYFFFITNDIAMPADKVVLTAGGRCDKENLIAQLKGGVHALTAPVDDYGEQLGVHGNGESGLEPEGVGRVAGALDDTARRGTPGPVANSAENGVRDVPRGDDRDTLRDRTRRQSLGVSLAVLEYVLR